MILTLLYVLGPTATLLFAFVLYALERRPIIGVRWLWLLERLHAYRRKNTGRKFSFRRP
jgi:hypothetical protein